MCLGDGPAIDRRSVLPPNRRGADTARRFRRETAETLSRETLRLALYGSRTGAPCGVVR